MILWLPSVESHVIPAQAGIRFFPEMDPRSPPSRRTSFAGVMKSKTIISLGRPKAHARSVESQGSRRWDPLTRPAPAGENAGCGPPSPPRGRGTFISVGGLQAHDHSESHARPRLMVGAFCSLPTADCPLPPAHRHLPIADCPLPTCPLPTCSLPKPAVPPLAARGMGSTPRRQRLRGFPSRCVPRWQPLLPPS